MKTRIPETDHGIQGEVTVAEYDLMQRHLRDKGWIATKELLASGIASGISLEIGFGPGYLGLEWLKNTTQSTLEGLDISPDMKKLALRNASQYELSDRVVYHLGNCDQLPFADNKFDAVFTNGSLHEWENPVKAFNEIWRVLKPGGRYFISDLRRDISFFMLAMLWLGTKPASMRSGLLSSINAAYIPQELKTMLKGSMLREGVITANRIDISIIGKKNN
jgi:ubiquinone/menaquinone biosynthesis C-methylase UbiE